MEIIVCSKRHDKEIFDYILQKRPNYSTQEFQKIYVCADDLEGTVEVIDNRLGDVKHHKFSFDEYMRYHEDLVMKAANELFPEGESNQNA